MCERKLVIQGNRKVCWGEIWGGEEGGESEEDDTGIFMMKMLSCGGTKKGKRRGWMGRGMKDGGRKEGVCKDGDRRGRDKD